MLEDLARRLIEQWFHLVILAVVLVWWRRAANERDRLRKRLAELGRQATTDTRSGKLPTIGL